MPICFGPDITHGYYSAMRSGNIGIVSYRAQYVISLGL